MVTGAVRPIDDLMVTQRAAKFNAEAFQRFLPGLIHGKRQVRKMVVVTDNARWHHMKVLTRWLNRQRKSLHIDFLSINLRLYTAS